MVHVNVCFNVVNFRGGTGSIKKVVLSSIWSHNGYNSVKVVLLYMIRYHILYGSVPPLLISEVRKIN